MFEGTTDLIVPTECMRSVVLEFMTVLEEGIIIPAASVSLEARDWHSDHTWTGRVSHAPFLYKFMFNYRQEVCLTELKMIEEQKDEPIRKSNKVGSKYTD